MQFKTNTSPFFNSSNNINSMMLQVLLALIPGTLVMFYFYGWGILFNIIFSVLFAVSLEALALRIRKRPIMPFLSDLSAIVTAWLLALSLPPLAPWWLILTGIFFAIIIAKHLYGGLGYNPFNPAMVGFAALIVSFPLEMSQWLQATPFTNQTYGFVDSLKIVFGSSITPDWDAITMATPLDEVKTGLRAGTSYSDIIQQSYLKDASSNTWLWSSMGFLIGGLWLIYKKVIHWQIPVALLASLTAISSIAYLYSPENFASPFLHLFGGATMLAAFFIATDPVSASTTPLGKLFYASSIGFFIYIIRTWGNYPDAVAFSVLIMNMAVPMIDYYTQPRVMGHDSLLNKPSISAKKKGKKQSKNQ
ncbi:MAG TPA: electron transport complex subunit RsxD [Leucothrix mucor]|nr:electron transport complex subunit RsxD [Leucothrix mucor]